MSHYNHELIALAIAFSYFAALMMLSIINKLNKSLSHDKKALLICSALIIGSSLWAIQLINAFALPSSSAVSYTHLDVYKRQPHCQRKIWHGQLAQKNLYWLI